MKRKDFGNKFKWGVSICAYQNEGAFLQDGKGLSIWDVFTNQNGKVRDNQNANTTNDFYHLFEDDLKLMKYMNILNFRFSLSWSRIFPNGTGTVNQKGVDFYNRLIDKCIELGIKPWVTLYHWDLPQALEERGGWTNRDVVEWFSDYVTFCVNTFGDRVKNWMILNEPMVYTGAGYFLGLHAPGRKDIENFIPAMHHTVLAQAAGGRIVRSLFPKSKVGTTFSCSYVEPASQDPRDILAANRVDALLNRLYIEPSLGLGYPQTDVRMLNKVEDYMQAGDEKLMPFNFDFIGIQNYTREKVQHSFFTPYVQARFVSAAERNLPQTAMGWEVYPKAMYNMLKKFGAYEGVKKILVTENGAAFPDQLLVNGRIHDKHRTNYLKANIEQMKLAMDEGINVGGYFVWTFTDNFEWAEGYHPRFGLVYVDFEKQARFIKDSGFWYRSFLAGNESTKL